jgi:DNA-binding PadR family transcriptional regulator
MHNERTTDMLLSKLIPLRHYAIARERTVDQVAAELKKDYSTILRTTKTLVDNGLLEFSRHERTAKRGKEKRYYKITLAGLQTVLACGGDWFVQNIRTVAKAHSDKSLVFAKWDKFVQNNCEQALMQNLTDTLTHGAGSQMVMLLSGLHPFKMTWKAFDLDILGFFYLNKPIDHVKEVLGNRVSGQMLVWKVVENDYEMRQFREDFLDRQVRDCSTALKSLGEWREFLKTLQK